MTKSERYEERQCWSCSGFGQCFDITNADKVYAPATSGRCTECHGTGITLHLITMQAHQEHEPQPVGEMPDWMC